MHGARAHVWRLPQLAIRAVPFAGPHRRWRNATATNKPTTNPSVSHARSADIETAGFPLARGAKGWRA
eukprot:6296159-Prymnesium_polylepis.1